MLLALSDLGLAMPLQEVLERMGHSVTWDGSRASGPGDGASAVDAIILDADMDDLAGGVSSWRDCDPPPAILVSGPHTAHRDKAAGASALYISSTATQQELADALQEALRLRFAGRMSRAFARGALELGPARSDSDRLAESIDVIKNSHRVNIDIVRSCLRQHTFDYVTATDLVAQLREHRALQIPQVDFSKLMDGSHTIKRLIAQGGLSPAAAGQLLWALLSVEAAAVTPEPPDQSTDKRRAVRSSRDHLRARLQRLARATHYDVLEVTPAASAEEVDHACRMLAIRYSPKVLGKLDLGQLNEAVEPNWHQILHARQVLHDMVERGHYNDKLAGARGKVNGVWAFEANDSKRAADAFRRGQEALVGDQAFKAVSAFASACRSHPEHPDYEASLAWARFRAEVERGSPRHEAVGKELAEATQALLGRRPWPRGLVALAMLCAAAGDPDAARWHLREALACDPKQPAAKQLLARLSK